MFEFLFKYPASAFSRGEFVFLGRWPLLVLATLLLAIALGLAWLLWRQKRRGTLSLSPLRAAGIWLLQTAMVALLLVMLWQPALSIATLNPKQNIVAVVVDDSKSMALVENGVSRSRQAVSALESGLLSGLRRRFQVRLYSAGGDVQRIEKLADLSAGQSATRLGESMKQVVAESASLPVGAVVLLSDGGENSGGIDLATMNEIRRQQIPIHTIGFGREKPIRDVELLEVQTPSRALAGSRLDAEVRFTQTGYAQQRAKLTLKEGAKVLASRVIVFGANGAEQSESLTFPAGAAGAKSLRVSVEPLPGEENAANNALTRLTNVDGAKPRVLYLEGEPKWEYKFLRRAVDLDPSLQLTSMLRTTQNKIYRQGVATPTELEEGFPATVEQLFGFQALVLGGVEAGALTATQQELIKQFVDRRGGGLLFLGGRNALSDGGYARSALNDLLPVTLPERKETFRRDPAAVELTEAGRNSLLCRLDENLKINGERWKKLPALANYQDAGTAKPGATVLAEMRGGGRKLPLLVTQSYGRGRTAVLATAGTWRWQMLLPVNDSSHEAFWQQMLRWLVAGTAGQVIASTPKSVFSDETGIALRVEVRDKTYLPMADARVEARILGPAGVAENVRLNPDARSPGVYTARWDARKPGSYVVESVARRGEEEVGRDMITFQREDGVAENFHTWQNRDLLRQLAEQTGGRYWKPSETGRLSEDISYSESGITTRETRDLWNMPILFLCALLLRSSEWILRRKWGVV